MGEEVAKKASPYGFWSTAKLHEHLQLIKEQLIQRERAARAIHDAVPAEMGAMGTRVIIDLLEHEPLDPDTVPGMYIVGADDGVSWFEQIRNDIKVFLKG